MALRWSLVGAIVSLAACRQGVGQRCQVDDDCQTGLICIYPGDQVSHLVGGTCQPNVGPGFDMTGAAPDLTGAAPQDLAMGSAADLAGVD